VSLGSSRRDKTWQGELAGQAIQIERQGVDGSLERFAQRFAELDGQVDALGVGGADLWLVAGNKRWPFRQIHRLTAGAKSTPLADGSALKHTLERRAVEILAEEGVIDWRQERCLTMSSVDRFGMAEALSAAGAEVRHGDLAFGLGLPITIRRMSTVRSLAGMLLPVVTRLPFQWFYPTGAKQDVRSPRFPKLFAEATVVAGDWPMICRLAPDRLDGKTIFTQTLRKDDLRWLREAGARRAIVTTPVLQGETLGTNAMEAALIALRGAEHGPLTASEAEEWAARLGWRPTVIELGGVD
jgi:hypothetical protein